MVNDQVYFYTALYSKVKSKLQSSYFIATTTYTSAIESFLAGIGRSMVGISLPDLNEPLPDDKAGGAVGQLLHEVPGLDPAHPGAVGVVHSHDLVANVENLGLVRSSAWPRKSACIATTF